LRIGGPADTPAYTEFALSLTVLATVVSASHPDCVTIDAGIKAFATDTDALPLARDQPELRYRRFGDEFAHFYTEPGGALPAIGERLELFVNHCDPTVNLYDRIYAIREDRVEAVWTIAARREYQRVRD
jgi:D-serine deaminase-like pyridoxal phosphate-dependent protein